MTTGRRVTTDRGRYYLDINGNKYWSVTTIIGGGIPKPALLPWATKSVAEYAVLHADDIAASVAAGKGEAVVKRLKEAPYRYTEKRADLGTRVHAAIDAYINEQPMPGWPDDVAPYMEQFERFLSDWSPEFEASELTVYNASEQYAGTLDFIARIPALGDGLLLGDTKTGKGVYGEVSLQLASYRFAEFVETGGVQAPMPQTEGGVVLHIGPRSYRLLPVECGEKEFRYFKFAREVYRFASEHSKTVIGRPLQVAQEVTV